MFYLPQYWPDLSPIEQMFGAIKSKLRCKRGRDGVNFNKASGKLAIVNIWQEIPYNSIAIMWIDTIKQAKKYIMDITYIDSGC